MSQTCLYSSISLVFGFVSFVTAIVGFYRGVVDIGYCVFAFAIVMLLLIRGVVSHVF